MSANHKTNAEKISGAPGVGVNSAESPAESPAGSPAGSPAESPAEHSAVQLPYVAPALVCHGTLAALTQHHDGRDHGNSGGGGGKGPGKNDGRNGRPSL